MWGEPMGSLQSILRLSLACLVGAGSILPAEPVMAAFASPEEKALLIYKRLTGTGVSLDDPIIGQMAAEISAQRSKAAARLVTLNHSNFYNVVVRDMFAQMSTREELRTEPLNDFIAIGIGVVRDNLSALELLTGNYYYIVPPATPNIRNAFGAAGDNILTNNNHYADIVTQGLDIKGSLIKSVGQKIFANNAVVDHPDPAGLLTTRAFMLAHASAGTNRRLVEYSFREFLCVPVEGWADVSNPDNMVSRDVDRFPGGSNGVFQVSCKGCHSGLDGLRTAFAKVDFNNQVNFSGGIQNKMNINNTVFPQGFSVTNTMFVNNAVRGANATFFGWDETTLTGTGIKQFGTMLAKSRAFPRCMVKRVFQSVCKRDPVAADDVMVNQVTDQFILNGYKMRDLFETVVSRPECIGN
jgi:hypothetical protein